MPSNSVNPPKSHTISAKTQRETQPSRNPTLIRQTLSLANDSDILGAMLAKSTPPTEPGSKHPEA